MENFGNKLYGLINAARIALFSQGELAQLTYSALDTAAAALQAREEEAIEFTYPVGWRADDQPINSTRTYQKKELLAQYRYLALHQLAVNGIIRLVTIIEAVLGDIVRALVLKYPQKLGTKRTVQMQIVLEASTIEDVHLRATDAFLHDLSYKTPVELAEELKTILSFNLLECPAYHKYLEVKATRDIYIHNQGVANDTYVRKAGTHVRVRPGMELPVHIRYFLESYEACLQLIEWTEKQLHERWHSSECEEAQQRQLELQLKPAAPQPLELLPLLETPSAEPEEN